MWTSLQIIYMHGINLWLINCDGRWPEICLRGPELCKRRSVLESLAINHQLWVTQGTGIPPRFSVYVSLSLALPLPALSFSGARGLSNSSFSAHPLSLLAPSACLPVSLSFMFVCLVCLCYLKLANYPTALWPIYDILRLLHKLVKINLFCYKRTSQYFPGCVSYHGVILMNVDVKWPLSIMDYFVVILITAQCYRPSKLYMGASKLTRSVICFWLRNPQNTIYTIM